MKNLFILIAVIFGTFSCTVPEEKEKEAIKSVIEEERDAFFARDVARQDQTWVQDTTSRKIFLLPDGIRDYHGWDAISAEQIENAESEMWDQMENVKAEFSGYEFNIYGNTALVICNTTWTGKLRGNDIDNTQKRILHFIKENGKWKFDLMAVYRMPDENLDAE
jgi:hypothetical protein